MKIEWTWATEWTKLEWYNNFITKNSKEGYHWIGSVSDVVVDQDNFFQPWRNLATTKKWKERSNADSDSVHPRDEVKFVYFDGLWWPSSRGMLMHRQEVFGRARNATEERRQSTRAKSPCIAPSERCHQQTSRQAADINRQRPTPSFGFHQTQPPTSVDVNRRLSVNPDAYDQVGSPYGCKANAITKT